MYFVCFTQIFQKFDSKFVLCRNRKWELSIDGLIISVTLLTFGVRKRREFFVKWAKKCTLSALLNFVFLFENHGSGFVTYKAIILFFQLKFEWQFVFEISFLKNFSTFSINSFEWPLVLWSIQKFLHTKIFDKFIHLPLE